MYSTPGISQSSFSIGRVARSSTSFTWNPGMDTSTSTIGTLICGSSSRGSITTANTPSRRDAMTMSSVSLELMNDCGSGNANCARRANGNGHAAELPGTQTRRAGQIQFYQIGAAVRIGGRRHFSNRAFNFTGDGGDANGKFVAEFHIADKRLRHVRFKPQRVGVFHLQQRLARPGTVPPV